MTRTSCIGLLLMTALLSCSSYGKDDFRVVTAVHGDNIVVSMISPVSLSVTNRTILTTPSSDADLVVEIASENGKILPRCAYVDDKNGPENIVLSPGIETDVSISIEILRHIHCLGPSPFVATFTLRSPKWQAKDSVRIDSKQ